MSTCEDSDISVLPKFKMNGHQCGHRSQPQPHHGKKDNNKTTKSFVFTLIRFQLVKISKRKLGGTVVSTVAPTAKTILGLNLEILGFESLYVLPVNVLVFSGFLPQSKNMLVR